MFRRADVFLCLCVLALNAVGSVTIIKAATNSILFRWSLPVGYFGGFHVYGVASSVAAVNCSGTVFGKNCVIHRVRKKRSHCH